MKSQRWRYSRGRREAGQGRKERKTHLDWTCAFLSLFAQRSDIAFIHVNYIIETKKNQMNPEYMKRTEVCNDVMNNEYKAVCAEKTMQCSINVGFY